MDAFSAFGLLLATVWDSRDVPHAELPTETDSVLGQPRFRAYHDGTRELLVPVPQTFAFDELKGKSVSLDGREFEKQRWMRLSCSQPKLSRVFAQMVDDVLNRIGADPRDPGSAVVATVNEWRELLRPARSISRTEALGLCGELWVLAELARHNPHFALGHWTGPENGRHDFATPNGAVEVKASESPGSAVHISSLRQLDPPDSGPLVLARLQFEETDSGHGVDDLFKTCLAAGCDYGMLTSKLLKLDYHVGLDDDPYRFRLVDRRQWTVDASFPGLRSDDIPESRNDAIRGLNYRLDLVAAEGSLDDEQWEDHLKRMMHT